MDNPPAINSYGIIRLSLHVLRKDSQMAKVKLNFRRLPVPEKLTKGKQIITSVTGNPHFTNPVPPLATLTAGISELEAAYMAAQAARQAWRNAVDVQTAKSDAVDQLFSQAASYVESVAGADESIISSAGMDPKSTGGAPTLPEAPTGLEITEGDHEGELDISWDPVSNAKTYLIQRSIDPNNPATWSHAGTATKSSTTIDALTSGTRYWFRVCAVGAVGQSGWSDPATKIAP